MARWTVVAALVAASALAGGSALAANPYPPPSEGSARVDPSRIRAGECAVFSGDGFAPGSSVALDDNGAPLGSTPADAQGRFSQELCFGADAKRGRHVLSGSGNAPGGSALTVSAVLIIEGVRQNAAGPGGTTSGAVSAGSTDAGSAPGATVGITEPDAVSGPGPGGAQAVVPFEGDDLGAWRLAAGMLGLLLALITSWWFLLLARRRRRDEQLDEGSTSLPRPAV